MATSEKIKGDDDDYQNGKSFDEGLVRVGQPQEGFTEHKGELSYGCAGPPARKSHVTRVRQVGHVVDTQHCHLRPGMPNQLTLTHSCSPSPSLSDYLQGLLLTLQPTDATDTLTIDGGSGRAAVA